ncbi:MAG: hypothetical protein LBR77_05090 [Lachnospiraceae bacterium]|jgi:hypothetical protein|nr:hypothetical protein [Lachnospiraceae bacterium]
MKRPFAIAALALFALLFAALVYVAVFGGTNKQGKILALLFAIFFLSIIGYAFAVVTKYVRDRRSADKEETPESGTGSGPANDPGDMPGDMPGSGTTYGGEPGHNGGGGPANEPYEL